MDFEKQSLLKLEEIADLLREIRDALNGSTRSSASAPATHGTPAESPTQAGGGAKAGRPQCPKCGGTAFTEHLDKGKVLMYSSGQPIYGKKMVCNKCGHVLGSG
ncbi:MAG: hypothetical protein Kow0069_37190 [Promethearchaeota archaeon]